MGNLKCLKNVFFLFDLLIKYYKFLKKEKKINLKVPSQQDIGILFSDGLSNNYSAYKKKGYLPNIWSRSDSEEFIIDDIFERLCNGNIIPSEIKFKKELIDFIDSEIKEYLNSNLDESTESFIEDLKIFKSDEQYDLYLKAVIEYSNRKPGVMYLKKNDFKDIYDISNLESKIGTTVKDWIDVQGCDWEDDTVESLFRGLNTDDVNNIIWKRISYDSKEYEAWAKLITRDFKEEFIKPKEEINNLFVWIDNNPKGIYNITGDGGVGKSFLLEGFQNDLKNNNIPSVIYRLSLGKFSDYRTFIIEMSFQIKQILPRRTQEIQTRNTQITDLREQFIEYIYEVMFSNSINKIVLIIDGINEIPDDSISLLSIIPSPEEFPEGLYIVLSGREMNNKNIIGDIERLKSNNIFWTDNYIDKKSSNYINLLNEYIEKELNIKHSVADLIIKKADGVFLFVYHFCKAIKFLRR